MSAMPEPPTQAPIRIAALPAPRTRYARPPEWASVSDAELLAMITGGRAEAALALLDLTGGLAGLGSLRRAAPTGGPELSPAEADRLATAIELARRLARARAQPGWRIRSPADVGERLRPAMRHLEQEELRTLLLNTKNVVTDMQTVYVGNLAGSSVRVGEIFRDAVRSQAAAIVVVHNHPSGDPTPSADDLRITAELAQAGRLLDIELLDHVVVGADGWVSLRSLGAT
jgi:DNA repair protein RadC